MVTSIGMILQQWAEMDIFFYALPFLLVFALVFAILQKLKLTGEQNKGIDAVIAIAIGLLALQYDSVPIFFQIIFPKLGIALSVILAALILTGLFVDSNDQRIFIWIFFGLGAVAFIILLLSSFQDYSWWTGGFWQENMSAIIAGVILIAFVAIVIGGNKPRSTPREPFERIGRKGVSGN